MLHTLEPRKINPVVDHRSAHPRQRRFQHLRRVAADADHARAAVCPRIQAACGEAACLRYKHIAAMPRHHQRTPPCHDCPQRRVRLNRRVDYVAATQRRPYLRQGFQHPADHPAFQWVKRWQNRQHVHPVQQWAVARRDHRHPCTRALERLDHAQAVMRPAVPVRQVSRQKAGVERRFTHPSVLITSRITRARASHV